MGARARLGRSASVQILAIAKLLLWFCTSQPIPNRITHTWSIMNTFLSWLPKRCHLGGQA